jgi:hypothetical protein
MTWNNGVDYLGIVKIFLIGHTVVIPHLGTFYQQISLRRVFQILDIQYFVTLYRILLHNYTLIYKKNIVPLQKYTYS